MIKLTCFPIHVTYTCPLSCAHCCFSSSPERKESLTVDHIIKTIQVLNTINVQTVVLTGGEPFLLGNKLYNIVQAVTDKGLKTRIVTSAYFGKNEFIAQKRLSELYKHGLNEITISWDDYHEKFISFESIYTVFWTAKKIGIDVSFNIVRGKQSTWTKERLMKELGATMLDELIVESDLNLTGRASQELIHDAPYDSLGILAPCQYVLLEPTLNANNKLLACCGVIPETQLLVIDDNFNPENIRSKLEEASNNPLLNWIRRYGPYNILQWIAKNKHIDIPDTINGNCEACNILFHNDAFSQHIESAVEEYGSVIMNEIHILNEFMWI